MPSCAWQVMTTRGQMAHGVTTEGARIRYGDHVVQVCRFHLREALSYGCEQLDPSERVS